MIIFDKEQAESIVNEKRTLYAGVFGLYNIDKKNDFDMKMIYNLNKISNIDDLNNILSSADITKSDIIYASSKKEILNYFFDENIPNIGMDIEILIQSFSEQLKYEQIGDINLSHLLRKVNTNEELKYKLTNMFKKNKTTSKYDYLNIYISKIEDIFIGDTIYALIEDPTKYSKKDKYIEFKIIEDNNEKKAVDELNGLTYNMKEFKKLYAHYDIYKDKTKLELSLTYEVFKDFLGLIELKNNFEKIHKKIRESTDQNKGQPKQEIPGL
jgi:hypothetical protein